MRPWLRDNRARGLPEKRGQQSRLGDPADGPDQATRGVTTAENEPALGGEDAPQGRRGGRTGELEDQVVPLAAAGEVLPSVVEDAVGADRAHQLQVPRAAHSGHIRAV